MKPTNKHFNDQRKFLSSVKGKEINNMWIRFQT